MSSFEGFEQANTTPVPDILFDELLSELSGSELKVLLYIIRRTRGFKKDTDAISLNQFQYGITTKDEKQLDKGCGIKRRQTIVDALVSLEKKGYIISYKTKTSEGDNDVTVYRIHFKGVVSKPDYPPSSDGGFKTVPPSFKTGPGVVAETGLPVVSKPDPQETVIQETVIQETVESMPADDSATQPFAPSVAHSPLSTTSTDQFLAEVHKRELEQLTSSSKCPIANTDTQSMATGNTSSEQIIEQKPLVANTKPKASSKKKERHTEPLMPKGPPQMPPDDMAWGTKKCLQIFDAWRGHILIGHYKLTQASTCAKGLAEQYTEEEVRRVYLAMSEDEYWKERGIDICNVANNIHKEIKKTKTAKSSAPAQQPKGSQQPAVSARLDPEKVQRNLERQMQRAIASGNYTD